MKTSTSNPIRFKRRSFLGGMGALALPWVVDPVQAAGGSKPNLLFVLVDQWRFCAFSHGEVNDALVQTPNFDQFVGEGLRWRKAYSTTPLCTPERSTLITGRYPHQTGMMKNDVMLPPGNRCIAEVFGEAGYTTHYIGKTHYDGVGKYNNVDSEGNRGWLPGDATRKWRRRGFTFYQGFNRGHAYMPTSSSTVEMIDDDGRVMTEVIGEYEPEFQTDLAMDFIERNRTRPWFCYLSWGPPHTPYNEVPAKYKTYTVTTDDRRLNVDDNPGAVNLANYFAQCTALDDNFGRLMQHLKDLGLEDNTLVVFTSDHGDMHYSHGLLYKSLPQEESMHIPLFMRKPGTVPSGHISDTLIGGVDMMPTLLGLCGLPIPKTCTGVDKSTAARGLAMPEVDSIYCEHQTPWRSIVTDRYKLVIQNTLSIDSVTLMYDLDTDPYELVNLKDDDDFTTIKEQLYDRLLQWIAETGDAYPAHIVAKTMYTT